jgi:hypothetical protein
MAKRKAITMKVHPFFKDFLKTQASSRGKKILEYTEEIAKKNKKDKRFDDSDENWWRVL